MNGHPAQALYQLHLTERKAKELEAQAMRLRNVLQGDPAAADPRPRLLAAEAKRKELSRKFEQAALQESTERARARSHEQQLYSGAIHSPKELSQLAAELDQLKSRLAVEEDEELALLSALDESDREVEKALEESKQAVRELAECEARQEQAKASIGQLRAGIPAAHLHLYDRVSAYRHPPPVVEVRDSVCTGCRIPLSVSQLRALRGGGEPQVCETCGRILLPA
jgi:predicted  nucleic acid-binding Zn-ribbon protein